MDREEPAEVADRHKAVSKLRRVFPVLLAISFALGGCSGDEESGVATEASPSDAAPAQSQSGAQEQDDGSGPIGGGAASGTGSDRPLTCPDGVSQEVEEWFGPVGLSLADAVDEAFGDLSVGRMGEPSELETSGGWSSWGLEDGEGQLVAVATMVQTAEGWDPSHARYCDIPQPEPEHEPFTLYVSNQSFEEPTVGITVWVDDAVVVDQDFAVEGQHNWITFQPAVSPGHHVLRATSSTGVKLEVDLALPDGEPRWAVLNYWYYPEGEPPHFTFEVSETPIGFA